MDRTDYLYDADGNWLVKDGDFVSGNSLIKEVGVITELNQGEVRSFPLIGPNLIVLINGGVTQEDIEERMRQHLKLDGIEYNQVKQYIKIEMK